MFNTLSHTMGPGPWYAMYIISPFWKLISTKHFYSAMKWNYYVWKVHVDYWGGVASFPGKKSSPMELQNLNMTGTCISIPM